MCETWAISETDFDDFLYDYEHFDYVRRKSPRANRNSGGVTVLVKSNLIRNGAVKRIFKDFSECVVLLIDAKKFIGINDILMIFAYVSPENSPIYSEQNPNGIDLLNDKLSDIISSYPNAEIFLAGDLNALFLSPISHIQLTILI